MTTKSATLTERQLKRWIEETLQESLGWHRGVNKIPEDRLADFEHGFRAGWRQLESLLRLHGLVER